MAGKDPVDREEQGRGEGTAAPDAAGSGATADSVEARASQDTAGSGDSEGPAGSANPELPGDAGNGDAGYPQPAGSIPDRELLSWAEDEAYRISRLSGTAAGASASRPDVTAVIPIITDDMIRDAGGVPPFPRPPLPRKPLPRVNAIWNHPAFQRHYQALCSYERDRPFCRHGIEHLLAVARLAWIDNLENGLGFSRELVYAAALLHDIGKAVQYADGIPHNIAGEKIASGILATLPDDESFDASETRQILTAIRGHRHLRPDAIPLERLIYTADKRSRACFACRAADRCKWDRSCRNNDIEW